MLLYLIRHAATERVDAQPAELWNLSAAGFLAAGALAGRRFWPEIGRLVTSTEHKAIATAAPAAELWRLPCEANAAFDEVRRGGYVEDYEAQVRAFFAQPERSVSGWERAADAQARAIAGLAALRAASPDANLALVGHGLLWTLLRAHLLGQSQPDPAEWRAIRMPDVALWRWEGAVWELMQDFEGIRHLSGANR